MTIIMCDVSGPRQQVDAKMAATPPASSEARACFGCEKAFCSNRIVSIG
jgi:hypothetical protein